MKLLDISYNKLTDEYSGYSELIERVNETGESYKRVSVDKLCIILEDILMTGSWYDKDCWFDRIREVMFNLNQIKEIDIAKTLYEVFYYILFEFRRQLQIEFNLNKDLALEEINLFLQELLV